MRIPWVAVVLPIVLGTSGCRCDPLGTGPTLGELGVAEFAWNDGLFGCLFGCDADEALAERAQADLLVLNYEDLPAFTVSSDAPAVAEFFHDGGDQTSYITVVSGVAGTATVTLSDTVTDETIDRLAIEVHAVDRIELGSPTYVTNLTIMLGGTLTLFPDLFDDRGDELKGIGGVDYTFSGGISDLELNLVSAIAQAILSIFTGTATELADVEALALGAGAIDVSAPSGAFLSIPVAIVDETAVQRIDLSAGSGEPVVAGESTISVSAAAFGAGDEPIYSPECAWSLAPAGGSIMFDAMGRDYVSLAATAPGTATVTCIIGSATASTDVTFQ